MTDHAKAPRTLRDYRPQHDESCLSRSRFIGVQLAEGSGPCTCGLDALVAPLVPTPEHLAVVDRALDALESPATEDQRREAWYALREAFYPQFQPLGPVPTREQGTETVESIAAALRSKGAAEQLARYLKDGESVVERVERYHRETDVLLGQLAAAKRRAEQAESQLSSLQQERDELREWLRVREGQVNAAAALIENYIKAGDESSVSIKALTDELTRFRAPETP